MDGDSQKAAEVVPRGLPHSIGLKRKRGSNPNQVGSTRLLVDP